MNETASPLAGPGLIERATTSALDPALIVVTADHGVSFRPGEPDPESAIVPPRAVGAMLSVEVESAPLALAVATDGTVRALTRTVDARKNGAPFVATLPESALPKGRHTVELFVAEGPLGRPRLIPTRQDF